MDTKRWIIFSAITLAVIAGMIYMSVGNRLDVSDIGRDGSAKLLAAEDRNGNISDHVYGDKDSKVVLIEYGDFQCQGCKTYAAPVKNLVDKYDGKVAFAYRHFPLTQIHPNARGAAAAAEAAGMQDKFWQMYELLFENQQEWSVAQPTERTELFATYARQLAMDEEKFKTDLADPRITQKINFDVALARMNEVTGTPTFLLNGKFIELNPANAQESGEPRGIDALDKAIEAALKEAGVEVTPATEE